MNSSSPIHKKFNSILNLNESSLIEFDSINIRAELEFHIVRFELFVSLNDPNNKKIFFLFLYYI